MLVIKKAYADPIAFEFKDIGPTQETLDSITESFNADGLCRNYFSYKVYRRLQYY